MVQPQPEGTLHWDTLGEDSGGALRVPPELASNEVVTRLLGDNQQLREALRNSNMALRQRCEEMEGWQRRTKEEREFLSSRFQEARALVERLAQENHSLQGQVMNGPSLGAGGSGTTNLNSARGIGDTQGQEAQGRPERNGLLEGSQALNPSAVVRKRTEDIDPHNQMPAQSLGDASVNSSINSSLSTPPTSLNEARGNGRGMENGQPAEGANEFLQLLKSHKEKLEEGMRELRSRNEGLEKEREESEREKDALLRTIEQFRVQLSQTQASGEEPTQRSEAQHSSDRYRELQEKLDSLQKISAQRDRSEALLKQKDKDCAQLAKDCEALKAQATSLLGELKERQSCLDKSEHDRKGLEDKLCSKMEALQAAERELEQQRKQQHVTVDKLRLQTQNLETALKTERHVITEERKKLTQLQHAYTCLFRDYDTKLKNETQGGDLCSRLEEAERALVMKQDLIDKLKEEVEQQRGSLETVPVLTAQAEIYKADFLAEREAREKLHQRKEELQDQLSQALAEIDRLKKEGTSCVRARIEEMQQRHMEDFRSPRQPLIPPQQGVFPGAAFNTAPPPSSFRSVALVPGGASAVAGTEELPDFRCPKCQYQAPDMDTLQIHVMDCIQ